MKKLAVLLFGLMISMSLFADANVKLVKAYSMAAYRAGCGGYNRSFIIKVKNLAYDKYVSVHHSGEEGESWFDMEAEYVKSIEDGYEIWKIGGPSQGCGATFEGGSEFVLKYEVDGNTYWDNNGGQNYDLPIVSGPMLGEDVNVMFNSGSLYTYNDVTTFSGSVDVKNVAYDKEITVVYTTDDWETVNTVEASYTSYYHIGYGNLLKAPNSHNVEPWNFSAELDSSVEEVKFAIAYSVDGNTYWDNNFGDDYIIANNN